LETRGLYGGATGPFDQELRELHGWAGIGLELPLDGALVLPQYFGAAARLELAGLEVDEDVHFPGLEGVAGDLPALDFADQASEAIEGEFAGFQVVGRGHEGLIGGKPGKL